MKPGAKERMDGLYDRRASRNVAAHSSQTSFASPSITSPEPILPSHGAPDRMDPMAETVAASPWLFLRLANLNSEIAKRLRRQKECADVG